MFSKFFYDSQGSLTDIYTNELLKSEEIDSFDVGRFENRYAELPMIFDRGDVVQDILSNEYYVVSASLKE